MVTDEDLDEYRDQAGVHKDDLERAPDVDRKNDLGERSEHRHSVLGNGHRDEGEDAVGGDLHDDAGQFVHCFGQ